MYLNEMNRIFFVAILLSVTAAAGKFGRSLLWGAEKSGRGLLCGEEAGKFGRGLLCGEDAGKSGRRVGNGNADRIRRMIPVMIFAFALAIRLWQFGQIPGGVNQDEAMAAVDGKALAEYGTDRFGTFMPAHLYAWGYGQMSALLSYLIAACTKIGGFNVVTTRLPLLLASMMGAVFFYFLMKDLFGWEAGLAAAAFAAIDPWHFMQSRWSLDCNLLPHFFIGGMYFLNRGLDGGRRKKRVFLSVSMIFFGLCMYCYGVALYTIPPLLLIMAVYYAAKGHLKISDVFLCVAVYLLVAWPFLLTMAINFFRWETIRLPFVTLQYFPDSVRSSDILFFAEHPLHQLKKNILAIINTVVLQKRDYPGSSIGEFGAVYLCSVPFVFAGLLEFVKRRSAGKKSLAVFTAGAGIWVGLFTNNINTNRINLIYYGLMMFLVLGILFTVKQIPFFRWTTGGIYALLTVMFLFTYFGKYSEEIKDWFYYGFGDALIRAEEAGTKSICVTNYTQSMGSRQVTQILTMYYDGTDAEYYQGLTNINQGTECLPCEERFLCTDISEEAIRDLEQKDVSFVVRTEETQYFDTDRYEIISYGKYSAVVPADPMD